MINISNDTNVEVISGDIIKIPSEVIITTITPQCLGIKEIDSAIQEVAGNHYHRQVENVGDLVDGDVHLAYGDKVEHGGEFRDVMFVVDELVRSLNEIIYIGMEAADRAGYSIVTIPTIRMGIFCGVMETTVEETGLEICTGIKRYLSDNIKTNLKNVRIVVFGNNRMVDKIKKIMKDIH